MNRQWMFTLLLALGTSIPAASQQTATDVPALPSHLDVASGFTLIRANAPPSGCQCFTMTGGFADADYNFNRWLSVSGGFTDTRADKISSLGQNLNLMTFMGGPRVTWISFRISPYVEFLAGGAHASGSYFPTATASTTSASSFSYSAGGGFNWNVTSRFALRPIDAKFIHTGFPNGTNDAQRQLEIGAGIVVHVGGIGPRHYAPVAELKPSEPEVDLDCTTQTASVTSGAIVQVIGHPVTIPSNMALNYSWASSGGVVQENGAAVNIDTAYLPPGTYHVQGRAALASKPSIGSTCEATFAVAKREEPAGNPDRTATVAEPTSRDDGAFHREVSDLFFDYDKADLRPDARETIAKDAAYLEQHPEIKLTIAGYSDERGSAEYNISLGLERAIAAREALAKLGVPVSRMEVLSYGKEKAFCSDNTERCYQENRRAQILVSSK